MSTSTQSAPPLDASVSTTRSSGEGNSGNGDGSVTNEVGPGDGSGPTDGSSTTQDAPVKGVHVYFLI